MITGYYYCRWQSDFNQIVDVEKKPRATSWRESKGETERETGRKRRGERQREGERVTEGENEGDGEGETK